MAKPWENAEGYHDPTAYAGMKPILQEEAEQQKRVNTPPLSGSFRMFFGHIKPI